MNLLPIIILAIIIFAVFYYVNNKKAMVIIKKYVSIEANNTAFELALLQAINLYRYDLGLSILKTDDFAQQLAEEHTDFMIAKGKPSHTNNQWRMNELLLKGAKKVGENVAYAFGTVGGVVKNWDESPKHQKVMQGDYTHIGISVKEKYFTTIYIKI